MDQLVSQWYLESWKTVLLRVVTQNYVMFWLLLRDNSPWVCCVSSCLLPPVHVCLHVQVSPFLQGYQSFNQGPLFLTIKTLFVNKVLFCHYELPRVRMPAFLGGGSHENTIQPLTLSSWLPNLEASLSLWCCLSAILDAAGPLLILETCPPLMSLSPISLFSSHFVLLPSLFVGLFLLSKP